MKTPLHPIAAVGCIGVSNSETNDASSPCLVGRCWQHHAADEKTSALKMMMKKKGPLRSQPLI